MDCEKCDTRIETLTNDNALREENAALWTKLNGVTITPEMLDLFVSEDDLQETLSKNSVVCMLNIDLTTYPEWGQKVSTYFLMVNKIE